MLSGRVAGSAAASAAARSTSLIAPVAMRAAYQSRGIVTATPAMRPKRAAT
jgi:hypothetical protein